MNLKVGLNLLEKCSKYAKACGKEHILQTMPQKLGKVDTCGLKLAPQLEKDVVELRTSVEQYTQIPRHHDICGINGDIRHAEQLKKGRVNDCQMIGGYQAVRTDNEFARLIPLEKDCIAYRGVQRGMTEWRDKPYQVINNAKVGDVIMPDAGCGYATPLIDLAQNFVGKSGMFYTIRIPKGAKVSRNMEHGGEILMPRNAKYKLISKTPKSDGKMDVMLEYILPKTSIPEDIPQIKKIAEQYINSTNSSYGEFLDEINSKYAKKILEEIEKLPKES